MRKTIKVKAGIRAGKITVRPPVDIWRDDYDPPDRRQGHAFTPQAFGTLCGICARSRDEHKPKEHGRG